jgi:stress-induced morphogen
VHLAANFIKLASVKEKKMTEPTGNAPEVKARLEKLLESPEIQIEERLACNGNSHITLTVSSASFNGKSRVDQHRMVNEELADLMKEKIHALQLKTLSTES